MTSRNCAKNAKNTIFDTSVLDAIEEHAHWHVANNIKKNSNAMAKEIEHLS